jgi:hypothetical protein
METLNNSWFVLLSFWGRNSSSRTSYGKVEEEESSDYLMFFWILRSGSQTRLHSEWQIGRFLQSPDISRIFRKKSKNLQNFQNFSKKAKKSVSQIQLLNSIFLVSIKKVEKKCQKICIIFFSDYNNTVNKWRRQNRRKNLSISSGGLPRVCSLEYIGRVVIKKYMGNPFVIGVIINGYVLLFPSRGNSTLAWWYRHLPLRSAKRVKDILMEETNRDTSVSRPSLWLQTLSTILCIAGGCNKDSTSCL